MTFGQTLNGLTPDGPALDGWTLDGQTPDTHDNYNDQSLTAVECRSITQPTFMLRPLFLIATCLVIYINKN